MAALGPVVLVLAACSGVPSSSAPEVIRSNTLGPPEPAVVSRPPQGAQPRAIVQGFLAANLSTADDKHAAAKQFLTTDARTKWSDSPVNVVADNYQVGLFDPNSNQLTVTAERLGTIDSSGIYAPSVHGDGTASDPLPLSFTLEQENGQWRIDSLQPGVLITESELEQSYQAHPLYFLDPSAQRLVADPRYSPLIGQPLAAWLLSQLIAGPRPELTQAVIKLPDQFTAATARIVAGSPTVVELPGSSQLDSEARQRVAAELAATLNSAQLSTFRITDGKRPVAVSGLPDPFGASDFGPALGIGTVPLAFFVADDGTVHGADGQPLRGPLGAKGTALTSVALAQDANGADDYPVAGIAGPPETSRLLVGTRQTGLHDSGVRAGPLTRAAWAPGQPELWVGNGPTLWRVPTGSGPSQVALPNGQAGTVKAVSLSRDAVRIALVLGGADGSAEVYVGTVERASKTAVTIDKLVSVTPSDVDVSDVAWNDDTTLYVVGTAGQSYGVWSVRSDGSVWTERSRINLPSAARQIAAAPNQFPWVSAGGAIFVQRTNTWTSPFGASDITVRGTSPTYLQ